MSSEAVYFLKDLVSTGESTEPKSEVDGCVSKSQGSPTSHGICSAANTCSLVRESGGSDETLLDEVKTGSKDALAVLFLRYVKLVRSIGVRILRNEAEADDLVQEVFFFVFRKARLFDPERGTGRSWLLQVAYHRAFDRRRYLKSRNFYTNLEMHEFSFQAEAPIAAALSHENSIEAALGRNAMSRIEDSLSEVQRRVIRLHFVEGNSLQEIAGILGQTVGNVRNHYYRSLEKMRSEVFGEKLRQK